GVARGDWNRTELTAERVVPDPFGAESGARVDRTGGVGRGRGAGDIENVGRNDFQEKIREHGRRRGVMGGEALVSVWWRGGVAGEEAGRDGAGGVCGGRGGGGSRSGGIAQPAIAGAGGVHGAERICAVGADAADRERQVGPAGVTWAG